MDKLTGAVAINCGALAGGNFPTSNLGVVFRGLADTAYEASPDIAAVDSFNMEMEDLYLCYHLLPDPHYHFPLWF